LQKIATKLNDGHTTLFPNYSMNAIYPFQMYLEGTKTYLNSVNQEFSSSLGKEIVKINNAPVFDVLNSFRTTISSENDIYFRDKVRNLMQFFSTWEGNPYLAKDSTLTLTFTDNSTALLKPVSKRQINIVPVNKQELLNSPYEKTQQPFLYKLFPEKSICYLQFNSCSDQSTVRQQFVSNGQAISEQHEAMIAKIPRFDVFLSEMFDTVAKNEIKTLVVDVRENGGGNSRLCEMLMSWFKPLKSLKSGTSSIRFSKLWEMQYPILANEYKTEFAKKDIPFEYGKLYESTFLSQFESSDTAFYQKMNANFQDNTDENRLFKGNIIFIQNEDTYSSAGMLIIDAFDNRIGTVIGTKSSYRPCNYGDMLSFMLPNTNIKGFVSHKIFYRPEKENCFETTLTPNVLIESTWESILSGNDKCWNWILENSK
jgi:hypothetical protein